MLWLIKNDGDGYCLHAESEVVMENEWIVPKNIRQVGESTGNIHIYIEDYAATFISQFVKTVGAGAGLGICCGRIYEKEQYSDIVIEGIVVSEKRAEEKEQLLSEELYRAAAKTGIADFPGQNMIGKFIADAQTQYVDEDQIRKMLLGTNETNSGTEIVLVADREEGIRGVWVMAYGVVQKVKSYYIYYDRNENMQNYLIRWNEKLRHDAVQREDEIQERKEIQNIIAYKRQTSFPVMEGVACVLLAAACVLGIVSINNYREMQNIEKTIEGIAGIFHENDQNTQTEVTKEQSGETRVEDYNMTANGTMEEIQDLPVYVPGGGEKITGEATIMPTQEAASTQEPVATQAPREEPIPTQEAVSTQEQVPAQNETVTEEPTSADTATQTVTYREYVVEQGDTLSSICYRFYQDRSKVDEVCQLNGIANPDRLAVGQKILLP